MGRILLTKENFMNEVSSLYTQVLANQELIIEVPMFSEISEFAKKMKDPQNISYGPFHSAQEMLDHLHASNEN